MARFFQPYINENHIVFSIQKSTLNILQCIFWSIEKVTKTIHITFKRKNCFIHKLLKNWGRPLYTKWGMKYKIIFHILYIKMSKGIQFSWLWKIQLDKTNPLEKKKKKQNKLHLQGRLDRWQFVIVIFKCENYALLQHYCMLN